MEEVEDSAIANAVFLSVQDVLLSPKLSCVVSLEIMLVVSYNNVTFRSIEIYTTSETKMLFVAMLYIRLESSFIQWAGDSVSSY